jgi:hypothetical protein
MNLELPEVIHPGMEMALSCSILLKKEVVCKLFVFLFLSPSV